MFFFQGLGVVLNHFFNRTQVLVDNWGCRLNHGLVSLCLGSSCGSGFTLAAAHFAWVVGRAAIAGQSACCGCCNHCHFNDFSLHGCFNWSGVLGGHSRLDHRVGSHDFSNHRGGFNGGRFGNWLAYNAGFLGWL